MPSQKSCTLAGKLPFEEAPPDDRHLPDMHMALYNEVVVFDQATKLAYVCVWLHMDQHPSPQHAYLSGKQRLAAITARLSTVPSLVTAKVCPLFCCWEACMGCC